MKLVIPFWRQITAVVLPLALLPLCLVFEENTKAAARCGYVMIVMGFYWIFELVPIPVTGLLPAVLFPFLGIQKADDVSKNYFQDSVMLFVGGLLVAIAVEHTNLHRRIALAVLLVVGTKPYWIMAGFMLISGILSMFISNTATTAMILPIAIAVVMELNKQRLKLSASKSASLASGLDDRPNGYFISDEEAKLAKENMYALNDIGGASTANIADIADDMAEYEKETDLQEKFENWPKRQQEISKALVLSVAYASSIGGMATLTGTLTNVVFKGQFEAIYPNSNVVSYASFSFFALPTMLLCLVFAWCWMAFSYFLIPYIRSGKSDSDPSMEQQLRKMFRTKYQDLGSMRFAEGSTLGIFLFLVLLWFFRAPGFMEGWDIIFEDDYISDATPAILMGFILFLWPSQVRWKKHDFDDPNEKPNKYEPILNWKTTAKKFPWDVVLLLGGALALADGVKVSGLTEILKDQLGTFRSFPPAAVATLIAVIVTCSTEFASNAAIASIFLPVVAELAEASHVNPLYYMLPVAISCSFAFMFPVATPPNAIVFGSGFLRVIDMVKAGVMLNIGCMGIMLGCLHSFGFLVFGLDQYPAWADRGHATTTDVFSSTDFSTTLFNVTETTANSSGISRAIANV